MYSKKKRNVKLAMKSTILDFVGNTSIHGLKYMNAESSTLCERMFWGMMICVMMLAAVYLNILHLRRFVENPTRSTIITFHGPVYLLPFPAVTICNANLILHSKITPFIKSLNLDDDEGQFLKKSLPQFIGFFKPFDYNKTDLLRMQKIFEKSGYTDAVTVLRKIGPSCREMLVQCRWNGEAVDCFEIFEDSLTIDGLCCSFNYYGSRFNFKPYYTKFTGWRSGLSVSMNSLQQKIYYSTARATGLKVTVHNSLEYPGFERTYKIVPTGSSSFFQISAQKLTNTEEVVYLSKEQRGCVFSGERPLTYHKAYYFSNCVVETYSRYIYQFCGCVPFYFTFSVKPKCNIYQMECLQRYISERRVLDSDFDCPARCENVIYKVITSRTPMNNVSISLNEVNKNKIPDESGIELNVFFTGTHTLLSRDALTSSLDLLSSIGGIYGLFIGTSIITIVEVIYYCTLRFLVNFGWLDRTRRDRKKRTNNPESEFRTGWIHRRHDVHTIEWNNRNNITFGRIG